MKFYSIKILFHTILRLPDIFFAILFRIAFPIYRTLHKKRAYGRVVAHLKNARANFDASGKDSTALDSCSADDVFKGIYWNAIDSYRGLARHSRTTKRIVFENEEVIRDAIANTRQADGSTAPIAAISIHQGSFELLHRSLCRYSNHVHLVTDTLGDGALRHIIQELRSDSHLTEYSPDQSRALIRNLFETSGILAMVFDQGKNTKGNKVKLFGQDSTLYLRLPELVNQMGAGIVTFRTFTRPRGNHEMRGDFRGDIVIRFETYYPPKYDKVRTELQAKNSSNKKESDAPLVESIAKEVETWITEHPAQWSWNYHGNFKV